VPVGSGYGAAAETSGRKEEVGFMPFSCAICAEESASICARCTQDTCRNHLCEKCLRCSDCCECEIRLDEPVHEPAHLAMHGVHSGAGQAPDPEPAQEPWQPPPEPDPLPPEDPEPEPVVP